MEKFTYLRDSLDGKAKILLEGLTLTKGNYTETRTAKKEIPKFIIGPEFIKMDSENWPTDISASDQCINSVDREEVIENCTFETAIEVICMFVTDDTT